MKFRAIYALLLLLPTVFFAWYFYSKKQDAPVRYLPYFGPKKALKVNDTGYHSIPDFEFTDQDGKKVNRQRLKDKIYVTEFFFTTCKSICPVMNHHLEGVYSDFAGRPDFMILSHTVDPENDSVPVLKDYAKALGVNDGRWLFVTGNKKDLYHLARKGYLLSVEEGDGGAEDFVHTQNFALVDPEGHIRGFYDGTDSADVVRLKQEINVLLKEYDYKKTQSL